MKKIWLRLKHLNRQRNLKTKVLKNKLKILILSFLRLKKTSFDGKQYQNIVIFMHSNGIGDAIVISGFIDILRKNNKKVYIIAEKRISFLYEELIPVDGVFEFDQNNLSGFKRKIKKYQFDLIIDFSDMDGTIINRLITLLLTKYKHAISFNQHIRSMYDTNITYNENKHITDRMLHVLSLLDITTKDYTYTLHLPEQTILNTNQFIQNQIRDNKLIIFNPFASEKQRSMSLEQIEQLLHFFEQLTDYKTIVFDIHNCIDFAKYNNVMANPFADFITSSSLVKQADLVVTVDTSIVHLAKAFNKKQIAIYNNRLFNNRFSNNIVWGPNCHNAKQITTLEHLNTESGDPIANLDINIIIDEIKLSLTDR